VLVSVWALLQKVGLISTLFYQVNDSSFSLYLSEGRSFGPFESPNYLAMFLSPVFFLSLPFFDLVKKKSTRLFFGGMMILPLLAIYFTNSRGGVISTVICVFVYLNYRYINHRSANKVRPFHQIVFTFLLVFINAAYLFYATRFVNVSSGGDSVRIEIYKYSLKILKSDWLLGTGLGNFQGRIGQISVGNFSFQEYALGYALHPHNLLLAVWLNLGLLGLIAAVYLIIIFFKKCFNSVEMIRASLIAAMFAILIHGLFDTTYFKNDLSAIFWLLIAGAFVLNRRQGVEIEE
jgi:O-antigen ligase